MTSAFVPEPEPRGILEHIEKALWKAGTVLGFGTIGSQKVVYGRSKFEGGEVAALRNAFISSAQGAAAAAVELKLKTGDILEILKDVTGYSEITKKELNYVLDEAGLKGQEEVDLDQFIEVSPSLFFFFLGIQNLLTMESEDLWQSQRSCSNAYTGKR